MTDQTGNIKSSSAELHTTESSFGGFTERVSYESSREREKAGRAAVLLRLGCVCLFCGIFATMCGILMYRLVQSNRELYYPMDKPVAVEESHTAEKTALAKYAADFEKYLVGITSEMADRYLVPEGVLVKSAEVIGEFLTADIKVGDIIVSLGGDVINDAERLFSLLTVVECCETKQVVLFRDNEYITLNAVIGK